MSTDLAESPAASTSTLPALEALAIVDNATNGLPSPTEKPEPNGDEQDRSQQDEAEMSQEDLRAELEQIKGEKEHLENQYRALLGKLTTMRNTLGDKLRQDAVGLLLFWLCSLSASAVSPSYRLVIQSALGFIAAVILRL